MIRSQRPRPRRRLATRPRVVFLAAVVAAFVLGLGLGEALHDAPAPGKQTLVRTLHPLPLVPIGRETVTVTTSNP